MPSLFIDGEWTASTSGGTSAVVNPFAASVVTGVEGADHPDVRRTATESGQSGHWFVR